MSRSLSKTLTPHGRFFLRRFTEPALTPTAAPPNLFSFSRRPYSSEPHFIEIDIDSSSSKADAEAAVLKNLNEFVRSIFIENLTPVWLPFAPGSSFWVPPHRNTAVKMASLVYKVTNPLTEEEAFSLFSPSGSPCSSFFNPLEDGSSCTQEVEGSMELSIPSGNEMLEVKLAPYPDPFYSFKDGRGDDED